MVKSILIILSIACNALALSWHEVKANILEIQKSIPSLSTLDKAEYVLDLIAFNKPNLCVEIGPFLGSYSSALGLALIFNQKGHLYCIDPWLYNPTFTYPEDYDQYAHRWKLFSFDGNGIYKQFVKNIQYLGLEQVVHPLRLNSLDAVDLFQDNSIDFLYVDGDTDPYVSLQEIKAFFPKIRKEGMILIDHAEIKAKGYVIGYLMNFCKWEKRYSHGIESVVFIKK